MSVAAALVTIILADGTTIETDKNVYIADGPVYTQVELTPINGTGELVEPDEAGSPEWCAWYEAINGGIVAPSFDPNYTIYVRNCRG